MKKAILYKEWIKTRYVFIAALIIAMCFAGYAMLNINRLCTIKGVSHLWQIILMKDNTFIEIIKMIPLVIGAAIAVAQIYPEMVQKRLKLTLHLPYSESRMVLDMLCVGLLEILVINTITFISLAIYLNNLIAIELVSRIMMTSLPWFINGFTAYLLVSAICFENSWKMRIPLILLAIGILYIPSMQDALEAYNGILWLLILISIACIMLSYHSIIRFKEGCQD